MNKTLLSIITFASTLYTSDIIPYSDALKLYQQKNYKGAYPIVLKEATRGNKEAQYLLATFYENGYGVAKDINESLKWYKNASSKYSYISEQNISKTNDNEAMGYVYSKIDTTSKNVEKELTKIVDNDIGILPYKQNYLMPFSYSKNSYTKNISNSFEDSEKYNNHIETEFQISLQKNISYNFFGLNEYITLGYTQHVWWQVYDKSSPFRETNYIPEIFLTLPSPYDIDKLYNLKGLRVGFTHESNGQDGTMSRSWNKIFVSAYWQWDNLFLQLKSWYRIPETKKGLEFYNGVNLNADGDDNPDILDYYGYGNIKLKYLYDEHLFGLMLRNNLKSDNKGALEFEWSYPMPNSTNTYWHLKFFNGYGESLIDYNRYNTKVGFGISFFRSMF
ncbi:MAG: phospholipase A [Campylobacterales bacterium]|nr:phospholipase A [Campylobacterales bacterium]